MGVSSVLFERVLVDIVFELPLLIWASWSMMVFSILVVSLLPKWMVTLHSSRTLHIELDIL
jgi:hypothetical protein